MLIHVRHSDQGELVSEALVFRFETASLLKRLSLQNENVADADRGFAVRQFRLGRGEKRFAQLTPATGHAFTFSIPEMIREEVKIVVSPLNSLSRPSDIPLHVQSPATGISGKGFYTDVTMGKVRLLYISPESLNSVRFFEELNRMLGNAAVSALIVDKVHCISEWSGAFMPAYLRIPQLAAHLQKRCPRMCVLALTAVPGFKLREDILRQLDFLQDVSPPEKPPALGPKISFQVFAVDGPREKAAAWRRLMTEDIPTLLDEEGIPDIRPMEKPCPDAYRLHERKGGNPPPADQGADVCVVTHPEMAEENCVQVIFRTALGENKRRWLFRAVNAATGGARVHCVRVADLPNAECEAVFRRNRSRVPACRDETCPFGRTSLCDYGRHHHFIQRRHPDLRVGLENAWRVLSRMLEKHDDDVRPLTVSSVQCRHSEIELALYRMAVLGMIEQFRLDYAHDPPAFEIRGFDLRTSHERCRRNLLEYLKRHDTSLTRIYQSCTLEALTGDTGEIAGDRDRFGSAIGEWFDAIAGDLRGVGTHRDLYDKIGTYFPVLIRFVRDEIRDAAYISLWNLKEWFRATGCRARTLAQAAHWVSDDWQCHACDRCGPPPKGVVPPPSATVEAPALAATRWLSDDAARFDATEAERTLRVFAEDAFCLLHRVQAMTEDRPRDVKALYLAAELSQDDAKPIWMADLFKTACRDLTWRQAIRLYDTLAGGDPELFDLYDAPSGPVAAPEADGWRYREARRILNDPDRTAMLGGRMVLNAMETQNWRDIRNVMKQRIKEMDGDPPVGP